MPQGEIDIVVGASLTDNPWDAVSYQGRTIQVESCAEIIAKKMHHRGHQAKARDLFDLRAVADLEPEAIGQARPFFAVHSDTFLQRFRQHRDLAKNEFDKIDRLSYKASFDECLERGQDILAR